MSSPTRTSSTYAGPTPATTSASPPASTSASVRRSRGSRARWRCASCSSGSLTLPSTASRPGGRCACSAGSSTSRCEPTPERLLSAPRELREVAAQVRQRALPCGLGGVGVVVAERVLLVAEGMTRARVDDELDVLAHAGQLLLELLDRLGAEEVVVLSEVPLHGCRETTP